MEEEQYFVSCMPFGPSGAHFTFRLVILIIFEEISNAGLYSDNIVISSQTKAAPAETEIHC